MVFTTNTGAKYANPIGRKKLSQDFSSAPISGSYCFGSSTYDQTYPWYAVTTVPFVSSSTGWVNLYSLQTSLPCITSSYINTNSYAPYNLAYGAWTAAYEVRFPNLTGSFDCTLSTNDFEIYSKLNMAVSGGLVPLIIPSPCPNPNQSKIYSYIGGVATVYTSSYFWNGANPTLLIDPGC